MKLTELSPEWLTPDIFIFKNPTGGSCWLVCKRVITTFEYQHELVYHEGSKWIGIPVVMAQQDYAWQFEGNDFNSLTVSPSIDASRSGNWHGFIRNGEIC